MLKFSTTPADLDKIAKDYRSYQFAKGKHDLICALPEGDEQPQSEFIKIL